jgi:hypothetical protein
VSWFPNEQQRAELDERLLPAALRAQQLAARRVPLWLRIAVLAAPVGYFIYSIATFTGPYRWVAVTQARIAGGNEYNVELAALLALIVCLLPAVLVMFVLRRVFAPSQRDRL